MKFRGKWSSLLTVTPRVTETSAENEHSELFINKSGESLELTSHFMFFHPQLWSHSFCLNSWHRCSKKSHVQTLWHNNPSLYVPLPSEITRTYALKPNMAHLSTCHRPVCPPPREKLPFKDSFNWLQLSPELELCLTAHTVMVCHGSCAFNTQFSTVTKEHFRTYCTWVAWCSLMAAHCWDITK